MATQTRKVVSGICIFILSVLVQAGNLTAVGDVMLGSRYPSQAVLDSCPKNPLAILSQIPRSPIVFCNIEGTFLDSGLPSKKCENCFTFRMPESYVTLFKDAGFNVVSLSNNHAHDFGERGTNTSESLLKQNGIHYASYDKPWDTFTIDGTKYGFCAFNVAWHRIEEAESIIVSMKSLYSILIASMHGGAEGEGHAHVPKRNERYYGENRGDVYRFAHKCIDAGASVILGHGPHVTRAVELYKGKFIAYSMGNFATCGFKLQGETSIAPLLQINYDGHGNFISGKIYPILQAKYKAPVIDTDKAVIREMMSLTKQDFPKTRLIITLQRNLPKLRCGSLGGLGRNTYADVTIKVQ